MRAIVGNGPGFFAWTIEDRMVVATLAGMMVLGILVTGVAA